MTPMVPSDFEWLCSSYCATGACVEARRVGAVVLVQDSKLPASGGGFLQAWSLPEWSGLVSAIKADAGHPAVDVLPTGTVWLGFQHAGRHEILGFDRDEWDAFVAGVRAGEFDIDRLSGPAASEGVGAGRVGSDSVAGADRAATGAGAAGNPPAPVAADRPLLDAIAGNRSGEDLGREEIPSAQGSGLRPSPATGAGEATAASSQPAPVAAVLGPSLVKPRPMSGASSGHDAGLLTDGESVLPGAAHTHFSGPNVASMNVPAGRDLSGGSTSPGATGAIATTGQPGLDFFSAEQVEVDYLAEVITEAAEQDIGFECGGYELARYILAAGYRRDVVPPAVVESWRDAAASALKWGSGPLVEHVTEASRGGVVAVATGGAPPDRVGVSGGKAGPGLTPVSPGPAEPTGGVS